MAPPVQDMVLTDDKQVQYVQYVCNTMNNVSKQYLSLLILDSLELYLCIEYTGSVFW